MGTADEERLETLVDAFLAEHRQLSAVERFSQRHADAHRPLLDPHYRALMPATPPLRGCRCNSWALRSTPNRGWLNWTLIWPFRWMCHERLN